MGLGLNLPLGPLMATVGGKGVYTNPNYGDEGYAAAVGGGLQWKIGNSFRLLASITTLRIRSPAVFKVMRKRMLARVTPLCVPVSIEAGYRYLNLWVKTVTAATA
ncbi:YfaZ family outer membrane protein [Escherichia coli]